MVDHAAGQGWSSVLARLLYGEEKGAVGVKTYFGVRPLQCVLTVRTTQEGYEVEGELRDAAFGQSLIFIHNFPSLCWNNNQFFSFYTEKSSLSFVIHNSIHSKVG